MPFERIPRKTVSVTLPSGRTVTMREPKAEDSLAANRDGTGPDYDIVMMNSLIMRSLVSVDGEKIDKRSVTARSIPDFFIGSDWIALRVAFNEGFFGVTAEELAAMRDSKSEGVED